MMNIKFLKLGFVVVLWMAVIAFSTRAIAVMSLNDPDHKHNLSSTSSGVRAVATGTDPRETQICIFCHTPHNAENAQAPDWAPLWNRQNTSASFQMASSIHVSTGKSGVDSTPTGISKKCLSCHDGTVAIGAVLNGGPIQVTGASGSGDILQSGDYGFIGTDLRGGHVISFNYKTVVDSFDSGHASYNGWDGANPISDSDKKSMFDREGKMQCHSCHDPHTDWCDDTVTPNMVGRDPLWRKPCDGTYGNASVCRVCHRNMVAPFQRYSF